MSFLAELKRRNVFKVAAAYIIVGWLIMQAGEVMSPALHLPDWINSALAFFLILGFPAAMILAWAFEMTPDGLKREKEVDRSQSITASTSRKLDFMIIGLLAIGLIYFGFDKFVLDPGRDAEKIEAAVQQAQDDAKGLPSTQTVETLSDRSIAVLPFVNMSDDASNEYFSDGLSEELLNLLAKIPELKVAARTSSFQFKGHTGDIASIASQLKVANVLEGSVRKAGNQVRITAQLIKADDGYHLWSETYDRTLDNIFQIQDEISVAVVDSLKITLLGAAPEAKEVNPQAYALYLQGRHLANQNSKQNLEKAAVAYRAAIEIDASYAAPWAGLSEVLRIQAGQNFIPLDTGVAEARTSARRAIELDPELAIGWSSLARLQSEYDWNWSDAQNSMQTARQLEPANSEVLAQSARLAQSLGQPELAISLYEKALEVDPLNQFALALLSANLDSLDRLDEAQAVLDRLTNLNPAYRELHTSHAWLQLRRGAYKEALQTLEKEHDEKFWVSLIKALALYSDGQTDKADAETRFFIDNFRDYGAYQVAEIFAWRGEVDEAFKWLETALLQHDPGMGSLLSDPTLNKLHHDRRWEPLLEKIGLLEFWQAMPDERKGRLL